MKPIDPSVKFQLSVIAVIVCIMIVVPFIPFQETVMDSNIMLRISPIRPLASFRGPATFRYFPFFESTYNFPVRYQEDEWRVVGDIERSKPLFLRSNGDIEYAEKNLREAEKK